MYRWLHLLDMAITPAMLRAGADSRDGFGSGRGTASVFRAAARASDVNRDKTDVIATFSCTGIRASPDSGSNAGMGSMGRCRSLRLKLR